MKQISEGDINLEEARKAWIEQITDPETRLILEKDAQLFLHQSMSSPCIDVIMSCKGAGFVNLQKKRFLDFHGNNVHQVGFSNSEVIERIKQQLDQLSFSTRRYTNTTTVECAGKITSLMPGNLKRVLFAPGGTSVVGMALKLARYITGKHKVISYYDSFHGASLDSISAGGEAIFRQGMGPMMPETIHIPPPMNSGGFFTSEMQTADYLEYVIEKEGDIGAFIAETIRNTEVQIPSPNYWKRVREICTRHNIILILDEIPIALGRTGTMFAFQHYNIEPDIICLGKGLGGGIIPFAAMVCREAYNIAQDVSLGHYTHEKSPLGSAAALATINYIEQHQLLKKVQSNQQWMQQALLELKAQHPIIAAIRGIGLLWGIELIKDGQPAKDQAEQIMYRCLENGLSFKVSQGNVIQLSPALTITDEELKEALSILHEAFDYTTRNNATKDNATGEEFQVKNSN